MKYLLDTNAIVSSLLGNDPALNRRLRRHDPGDIAISAIVSHELYYVAFKSARPTDNEAMVDGLQFQVLDFDREDARHAGEIRAFLALRGMAVGPFDILIAGQARARKLVLVTHDIREFSRVPGLRIEDWGGCRPLNPQTPTPSSVHSLAAKGALEARYVFLPGGIFRCAPAAAWLRARPIRRCCWLPGLRLRSLRLAD